MYEAKDLVAPTDELTPRTQCEYCEDPTPLMELEPYVRAQCVQCGTLHGWNDQDAWWFGL